MLLVLCQIISPRILLYCFQFFHLNKNLDVSKSCPFELFMMLHSCIHACCVFLDALKLSGWTFFLHVCVFVLILHYVSVSVLITNMDCCLQTELE